MGYLWALMGSGGLDGLGPPKPVTSNQLATISIYQKYCYKSSEMKTEVSIRYYLRKNQV
jgi:hypothetical protein